MAHAHSVVCVDVDREIGELSRHGADFTYSLITRHLCSEFYTTLHRWVTKLGPKMGQIGPKWDKSGTFSDQISVHFGAQLYPTVPRLLT